MGKSPNLLREGLSRVMAQRGWKQKDLAGALGMPPSHVSRLFSEDASSPTLETIYRIASDLGLEPWELIKPPGAPREAPDSRLALFGSLVSRLAALNEAQLRFLLPYVDAAMEINGPGQRQELRDKNRKL